MSLYAANNIAKGIKKLKSRLGGIICNCKGIKDEARIVGSFAERIGSKVIGVIPKSELVPESEIEAMTVIEKFPDSKQAMVYHELAERIYENKDFTVPEPLAMDEFEEFFKEFKKRASDL